jgi:hypothetical protein
MKPDPVGTVSAWAGRETKRKANEKQQILITVTEGIPFI